MKFKKSGGIWNQENKKEIAGKIRSIKDDVEVKGYKYRQYILETEDEVVSVLGSTVLDKILTEMNIQVGEFIKIKFLGMKKPEGDGQEYKTFEVSLGIPEN